jgi:nicotinamidase-related amidase
MSKNVALIICDIQKDIINHHAGEAAKGMIANVARLIPWCREHGYPIIYSCIGFEPDYSDAPAAHRGHLAAWGGLDKTKPGIAVVDELAPRDGEYVFIRNRISSFYNTGLNTYLKEHGIDTVLITGCSTARVVDSTARSANDRDYRTIVVSDGCSADKEHFHINHLETLADFIAEVKSTDEVMAELD